MTTVSSPMKQDQFSINTSKNSAMLKKILPNKNNSESLLFSEYISEISNFYDKDQVQTCVLRGQSAQYRIKILDCILKRRQEIEELSNQAILNKAAPIIKSFVERFKSKKIIHSSKPKIPLSQSPQGKQRSFIIIKDEKLENNNNSSALMKKLSVLERKLNVGRSSIIDTPSIITANDINFPRDSSSVKILQDGVEELDKKMETRNVNNGSKESNTEKEISNLSSFNKKLQGLHTNNLFNKIQTLPKKEVVQPQIVIQNQMKQKEKEKEKNSFTNSYVEQIECASAFQSPKYLTPQTIIQPINNGINDENAKINSSYIPKKDEIPNYLKITSKKSIPYNYYAREKKNSNFAKAHLGQDLLKYAVINKSPPNLIFDLKSSNHAEFKSIENDTRKKYELYLAKSRLEESIKRK